MSETFIVRKWAIYAGLAAVVTLAAFLRWHGIADKSFWTDEGVSAAFTKLDWYNFGRILWRREGNMTLYYLLLRAWTQMGDSVTMIRAMSAAWSVGAVLALFALGRRLFGSLTGLTAASLLALNAYSVRYAQEARSYSMVACLVIIAALFFVRAVETSRRRDWTWYVVFSALSIYAQFFAVLVLVAEALMVCWAMPSRRSEMVTAGKKIVLWTLPVWLFIATTGAGPIGWIQRPNLTYIGMTLRQYAGNGGWILLVFYTAFALIFVSLRKRDWKTWLLLSWLCVPVLVTLFVSMVRPVFLARYLIVCLSALVLMVAAGITSLKRWWLAVPVLAIICWISLGGVRAYYASDFDLAREDCRSATEYVLAHAQQGDAIAFHKAQNRFAFSYYADHLVGTRPEILFPGGNHPTWRDFFGKPTPQVLDRLANTNGRVWLVISEPLGPEGEDTVSQQIKDSVRRTHQLLQVKDVPYMKIYLYSGRLE